MSRASTIALGLAPITFAIAAAVMAVALLAGGPGSPSATGAVGGAGEGASAWAMSDIPPGYLRLYRAAGASYGLDWAVLAAIGKVECDHGRDPDPSCSRAGAVNAAGAGGPMQFLASTWSAYGVDGDGDGRVSRWDPADAIPAAARYLRASGAPRDYAGAILAYNHARWYLERVEALAARYRGGPAGPGPGGEPSGAAAGAASPTPVRLIAGTSPELAAGDGHLALIPAGAPPVVQAMLVAGNELQSLPYGPAGHPDPRGAQEEDCSSTVNYVLFRAGVRPIAEIVARNPLAQDYVDWGDPGPGRWVSIYATDAPTPHVFIIIDGLRLDTSHAGTDTGPNAAEDGPRWRLFDRIPTWASWSIRHPPGL